MKTEAIVSLLQHLEVTNTQTHRRTGWVISRCPLGVIYAV